MQRTLPPWLAVMIIVASCSGNKSFQVPEHSAMASFDVPLYQSMADVVSGTSFKSLKAATLVYTTNDTIDANNKRFVKVVWGDSSAYVAVGQLLPQGRLATITADNQGGEILVYKDPQKTEEAFTFPFDFMMVVVGPPVDDSTPVMYRNKDLELLQIGYVPSSIVSEDSLGIEFFKKYYEAIGKSRESGSTDALDELKADTKYQALTAWAWKFADDTSTEGDINQYGEGDEGDELDATYADGYQESDERFDLEAYNEFTSSFSWIGIDGETPLTESEIPGTLSKYFVLENDLVIDAKGLWLLNYYPEGSKLPEDAAGKIVTEVRFEFTASTESQLDLSIEVWDRDLNYSRTIGGEQIDMTELGKRYSVSVDSENLCSAFRVVAKTTNAKAASVVSAECGD